MQPARNDPVLLVDTNIKEIVVITVEQPETAAHPAETPPNIFIYEKRGSHPPSLG
jgi:hypothetical protein